MIFKVKKTLQLFVILSSVILSNAVEVTEEELKSFSYGTSQFRLAVVGDTGAVSEATEVLRLSSYDALLHLGDFDYEHHADAFFDKTLPSDRSFKFMGVLGNHDYLSENSESISRRFRDNIYNTMRKSGLECKFSDSKFMWSCHYHNMRVIGLTPGIKGVDDRSKQLRFLKDELSKATEDWKICAWHYYDKYYHTGRYQNDGNLVSGDGESFYDYCKEHGAIIFSAHDHVYARTRVMSKFSSHEIDQYDGGKDSKIIQIRKGATINILNGAGGYEMYEEKGEQKDYRHWAKKYALGRDKENQKKFGGLFCTFNYGGNKKKAYCEFLRINSSEKRFDYFTIYQNENPGSVSYSDIDKSFLDEKKKEYLKSKGIVEQPLTTNTTDTNASPSSLSDNPIMDDINIMPDNSAINKEGVVNDSNKPESKSKSSKTGIAIGVSACAVAALAVGGLIVLKMKKNKHSIDETELVMKLPDEEYDYRNQMPINENRSVVDDDFIPLPMPSYHNNYHTKSKHNKNQ